MEIHNKNLVDTFEVNEMLHEGARELSGVYSRLGTNFPLDPRGEEWKAKMLEWTNYDRAIRTLVIPTKADADLEVARIAKEVRTMLTLEREMMSKK